MDGVGTDGHIGGVEIIVDGEIDHLEESVLIINGVRTARRRIRHPLQRRVPVLRERNRGKWKIRYEENYEFFLSCYIVTIYNRQANKNYPLLNVPGGISV